MMTFLLTNWKSLLAAVATAWLAYLLHIIDINRIEARHRDALAAQAAAIKAECDSDKKITEGVSDAYQSDLAALNAQRDALRVREPSRCIPLSTASAARRRDASADNGEPSRKDEGVTSEALIDFASDAERYRLQLIACQSFINRTWGEKAAARNP